MYDSNAALQAIDQVIPQGPYAPTWESLSQWQPPKWYQNAKFGIFVHWGVYSVPAFGNEWYPRNMYVQGFTEYEHHIKTYGPHKDFGYKDFIPLFKLVRIFDAESGRFWSKRRCFRFFKQALIPLFLYLFPAFAPAQQMPCCFPVLPLDFP